MITLLEAQVALQNAKPNEVKILRFPNGNWQIEIKPHQDQIPIQKSEPSKWSKFADEMHQKSPLRGKSEQVNALIKQFRHEFTLRET